MSEMLSSANMGIQRFWQWWTLELADVFSSIVRPKAIVARRGASLNDDACAGRLRLDASAYFLRRIEIPAAARRDVQRLLDLDLERATPFAPGDVYTAHYIDDTRRRPGFLNVCQVIVQRDHLNMALADARAGGRSISHIDCWNAEGTDALPVNLLPATTRDADTSKPVSRLTGVLTGVLAATAAALTVCCIYIAIARHEAALDQLNQDVSIARDLVRQGQAKARAIEDAKLQAETLQRVAHERIDVVRVLDNLTRALPDSAWLTELRFEGDSLHISGFAKPAAALVAALEQTPDFTDATFTSPVVRDGERDREHFSLRVRIGKAGASKGDDRHVEEGSQ